LNRIRIEETGEPLVEIIHRRRGLFVCCDRRIWARATVVEMLARAQESLPAGLHLFVIEGYRSLARQRVLYERFWAQSLAEHPEWPLSVRRRMVNRMIAPTDVTCPPGHCTGGALDVSLVTADGREIDMISPCEGRLSCPTTFYDGLTPEALANRRLLCETLEAQGFRNYPYEWWHYSYGDSGWAFRMNLPACPYGAAPPPPGYSMPTTEPG
jgi:D-alanyl-D-alanine dipeptidase